MNGGLNIAQKDLDLELAEREDVSVVQALFHVRVEAAPVDIGPVGRPKVHDEYLASIPLHDSVQPGNAGGISLIGCQVDIGHDRLAFAEAAKGKFVAGGQREDLSAVH